MSEINNSLGSTENMDFKGERFDIAMTLHNKRKRGMGLCKNCNQLGHYQKTCPLLTVSSPTAAIGGVSNMTDSLNGSGLGSSLGETHSQGMHVNIIDGDHMLVMSGAGEGEGVGISPVPSQQQQQARTKKSKHPKFMSNLSGNSNISLPLSSYSHLGGNETVNLAADTKAIAAATSASAAYNKASDQNTDYSSDDDLSGHQGHTLNGLEQQQQQGRGHLEDDSDEDEDTAHGIITAAARHHPGSHQQHNDIDNDEGDDEGEGEEGDMVALENREGLAMWHGHHMGRGHTNHHATMMDENGNITMMNTHGMSHQMGHMDLGDKSPANRRWGSWKNDIRRFVGSHFPVKVKDEKSEDGKIKDKRHRCKWASCKRKSKFKCTSCDVFLCIGCDDNTNCFIQFHTIPNNDQGSMPVK